MTFLFGGLFGFIYSAQQLFTSVFYAPHFFTLIFALIAMFIAAASLLNARLVERLGMRLLSHSALLGFIILACLHALLAQSGHDTIYSFVAFQAGVMFCFGLMAGNFGAIAMEPLGHVAGTAASVQGFISTVGGAVLGSVIGQSFNGTDIPITFGFACYSIAALLIVLLAEKGRLFRPAHAV
jgi:DHA1 family bicyclomycin/chloramphenicol resistance-like MFS transporter